MTGLAHARAVGWLGWIGAELLLAAGSGTGSLVLKPQKPAAWTSCWWLPLIGALLAQATHLPFSRFTKAIS